MTLLVHSQCSSAAFLDDSGTYLPFSEHWTLGFLIQLSDESWIALKDITPSSIDKTQVPRAISYIWTQDFGTIKVSYTLSIPNDSCNVVAEFMGHSETNCNPLSLAFCIQSNQQNSSLYYLSNHQFSFDNELALAFETKPSNVLCLNQSSPPLLNRHHWILSAKGDDSVFGYAHFPLSSPPLSIQAFIPLSPGLKAPRNHNPGSSTTPETTLFPNYPTISASLGIIEAFNPDSSVLLPHLSPYFHFLLGLAFKWLGHYGWLNHSLFNELDLSSNALDAHIASRPETMSRLEQALYEALETFLRFRQSLIHETEEICSIKLLKHLSTGFYPTDFGPLSLGIHKNFQSLQLHFTHASSLKEVQIHLPKACSQVSINKKPAIPFSDTVLHLSPLVTDVQFTF